jgi:putative phosphoesterase
MKWLIVSDTHGLKTEVFALRHRYDGEVEAMIHCGDSELTSEAPELQGFLTVEGNCDRPGAFPDEVVQEIGPLKFLIAHGHLLGVRHSPYRLMNRGLEQHVQVVCYGHTHMAGAFEESGMIFINPGSLRLPRNAREGTYALLELPDDRKRIAVRYYTFTGEPVDSFSRTFSWDG